MPRAGPATRRPTAAAAPLPRAPAPGALTGHFRSTKASAARPAPIKPSAVDKGKAKVIEAIQAAADSSTSLLAAPPAAEEDDDDADAIRSARRKRSTASSPAATAAEPATTKRRRLIKGGDEAQTTTAADALQRPSTPPRAVSKRATPTASPRAGLLGAPMRSPHSPAGVGVRTDPDSGKMWLLLPGKASPKIGAREWAKRMREEETREQEQQREAAEEPEEDLTSPLKPGRDQGIRVRLGSPLDKNGRIPPSTWEAKDEEQLRMARQAEEEDEQLDVLRPKQIREAPTGKTVPLLPERGPVSFLSGTPSKKNSFPPSSTNTIAEADEADFSTPATFVDLLAAPGPKIDFSFAPLPRSLSRTDLEGNCELPPHYATLLTLHSALEHALVVHLATSGSSYTTSTASASPSSSSLTSVGLTSPARSERTIGMPNLIRYSELRPLVERSSGRRLGDRELKSLACLWSVDPDQVAMGDTEEGAFALHFNEDGSIIRPRARAEVREDAQASVKEVKGLGFIVGRTRCIDNRGRKAWDWSLGIEVKVAGGEGANVGAATFPDPSRLVALTSAAPSSTAAPARCSTPPPSALSRQSLGTPTRSPGRLGGSSVSSSGAAREGMSVVAMWNLGMEERKREVRRRLAAWAARAQEGWRIASAAGKGKGKETGRDVEVGNGGLLTPSATRQPGAGGRATRFKHIDEVLLTQPTDFDDDDEDSKQAASPSTVQNGFNWDASFPLKDAPRVPMVDLPILKDPTLFNPSSLPSRQSSSLLAAVKAATRLHGPGLSTPTEETRRELGGPAAPGPGSIAESSASSSRPGPPQTPSTSARALSLEERIRAKEAATRNVLAGRLGRSARPASATSTPAGGSATDSDVFGYPSSARIPPAGRSTMASSSRASSSSQKVSRESIMASFKRRSTLSRLDDVAEAIFMLFTTSAGPMAIASSSSSSSSSSTTNGSKGLGRGASSLALSSASSRRAPLLPYPDVISTLIKSSKVSMSRSEADEALNLLGEIAPGFLEKRRVGGRVWCALGADAASASGSGGGGGGRQLGGQDTRRENGESLWGGLSLRDVRERIRVAVRDDGNGC